MEKQFLKFVVKYAITNGYWDDQKIKLFLDEFQDVAFFIFDYCKRKFCYANAKVFDLVGYTISDLTNASFEDISTIVHPDDYPDWLLNLVTASEDFKTKGIHKGEFAIRELNYRIKHSHNFWVWLYLWVTPFRFDPNGKVKSVIGLVKDVSKEKEKESFLLNEIAKREQSAHNLKMVMGNYQKINKLDHHRLLANINEKISPREIEVLQLIAEGYSNKEIAEALFISPNTAVTHRKNLLSKFQVKNSAELVKEASKMFWLI